MNKYPEMRWTPERVSRFWDWQSQYPENYFTFRFGEEIARSLKVFLEGRGKILDYGCGVGYLLPHLCKYSNDVYGADPSEQSVARTNERLAGTPSFKGATSVSALRSQKASFDAILVVEVIEHLDDETFEMALADIRALLAPSGIVIFTTPNNEDLSKNMLLCPATGEVFHRWQHVRSWNSESLPARLRESGFVVVEVLQTNMAEPKRRTLLGYVKRMVKRRLLGDPGKPHLVCAAKLAARPAT